MNQHFFRSLLEFEKVIYELNFLYLFTYIFLKNSLFLTSNVSMTEEQK